jgi:hypothetical protein
MEDHKDVPHEKGGAACLRDAGVLLGAVSRNRYENVLWPVSAF